MVLMTLAAAVLLAQAVNPTPAPLKLIAHVRSSALCTALRNNLFHAVQGLRADDAIAEQGRLELAKMAVDSITSQGQKARQTEPKRSPRGSSGNSALRMDHYQLAFLIQALSRGLAKTESLLSDPNIFVNTPTTPDQSALSSAKARLDEVAIQQKVELNLISGTAESTALQMLSSKGDGTAGALERNSHPEADVDLQNELVGANAPSQSLKPAASLFANNAFAQLAVVTLEQETVTGTAEGRVLPVLMPIIDACR